MPLDPGFVESAAAIVRRLTGLVFTEARRGVFEAGLEASLRRTRARDPESFLDLLENQPGHLDDLVAEITVGETYFFRDEGQFAVLREEILPQLLESRPNHRPMRIWSAGCASGEEPYSLAIVTRRINPAATPHILGTDLSRAALAKARAAHYGRWSLRGVAPDVVGSCFQSVGDRYTLAPKVRAAVEFRYLNLKDDAYPSLASGVWGMDLILCRNVLIYLDAESVRQIATRLLASLSDDGWLLLGASDPPIAELVPCEVVITKSGLAYRKPKSSAGRHRRAELSPPIPTFVPDPAPVREVATAVRIDRPAPRSTSERPSLADGLAAYARQDYERAATVGWSQVRSGDTAPATWILIVRSLANRGDLEGAGRACAAGLATHPTDPELNYLHAVLLTEAGHFREAGEAARRTLYLDPRFIMAHLGLGAVLTRMGDTAGARRSLKNAARLLTALGPDEIVTASDGETAARLGAITQAHLDLLSAAKA